MNLLINIFINKYHTSLSMTSLYLLKCAHYFILVDPRKKKLLHQGSFCGVIFTSISECPNTDVIWIKK